MVANLDTIKRAAFDKPGHKSWISISQSILFKRMIFLNALSCPPIPSPPRGQFPPGLSPWTPGLQSCSMHPDSVDIHQAALH